MFLVTLIICIAAVVIITAYLRNQRFIKMADEKTKRFDLLLNRFDSSTELNKFLDSGEGKRVIDLFAENKWDYQPLLSGLLTFATIACIAAFGTLFITLFIDQDLIFACVGMTSISSGLFVSYFNLRKTYLKDAGNQITTESRN